VKNPRDAFLDLLGLLGRTFDDEIAARYRERLSNFFRIGRIFLGIDSDIADLLLFFFPFSSSSSFLSSLNLTDTRIRWLR